jgi:hypothetical protein
MSDKWMKVAMGLVAARRKGSSWLMIVDADDLVSSALSGFLLSERDSHGFAIRTGYRYRAGSRLIHLDTSFNCGTNAIIRADRVYLPESLEERETRKCLMLTAGHTIIEAAMEAQSMPLARLPFPGAVYVQHASQHSVAAWPERRPIWRRTMRENLGALRRLRWASSVLPRGFGVAVADMARINDSCINQNT